MAEYFHIDTGRTLRPGMVLGLTPRPELRNDAIAACFDDKWPEGLASFGQDYVFGSAVEELVMTERKAEALGITGEELDRALNRSTNRVLELVWELVRLLWFPSKPSRLQSVFGYSDLDAAKDCRRDDFGDETLDIWRVEAQDGFTADSAWLSLGGDITVVVARACAYWSGHQRPGSMPDDQETLLRPPVVLLDTVVSA